MTQQSRSQKSNFADLTNFQLLAGGIVAAVCAAIFTYLIDGSVDIPTCIGVLIGTPLGLGIKRNLDRKNSTPA